MFKSIFSSSGLGPPKRGIDRNSTMKTESVKTKEKEEEEKEDDLDHEVANQLDRIAKLLRGRRIQSSAAKYFRRPSITSKNNQSSSRRGSIPGAGDGISRDRSRRNSAALAAINIVHGHRYRQKSLSTILERKESPPPLVPVTKPPVPIPETRPLGHEIERSGLPANLFDLHWLEPNTVFIRDEMREVTHVFKISVCPGAKTNNSDQGVYYTTYTGRPAVLKFFGDGLGWRGLSMWQQECEARERMRLSDVLPELYLAGEVTLGQFGHRTCRGYAIVMERGDGELLAGLQMSPEEYEKCRAAIMNAVKLVRERGMLHGEPCSNNVIWNSKSRRVMLLDWKEWWENEYGLEVDEREIDLFMKVGEGLRRSSLMPM